MLNKSRHSLPSAAGTPQRGAHAPTLGVTMKVFERWCERTGKHRYIEIPNDIQKPLTAYASGEVCGWFAQYREGLFAFWLEDERQFVRWRDNMVQLKPYTKINWRSGCQGRHIEIVDNGKKLLEASYHTLLRNPGAMFESDWWGLTDDLPSFVHSGHEDGTLAQRVKGWALNG